MQILYVLILAQNRRFANKIGKIFKNDIKRGFLNFCNRESPTEGDIHFEFFSTPLCIFACINKAVNIFHNISPSRRVQNVKANVEIF